jgi:ATP-dependent protease ClpP protease subunit
MPLTTHHSPLIDLAGIPDRVLNQLSAESFRCRVVNQTEESAELLVMGQIGDELDGLRARDVAEFLAENRHRRILVRINSLGGLAFDGTAIYNALAAHPAEVVTQIEGIAASAAATIAIAGRPVRMAANGSLMIHRAMGLAIGNRAVMEDMVEWLDKIDQTIAVTYAAKTGKTPAAMLKLMEGKLDGTTFSAEEALGVGLIDEVLPIRRAKSGGSGARDQGPGDQGSGDQGSGLRDQASDPAPDPQEVLRAEAQQRLIERQRLWEIQLGWKPPAPQCISGR